MNRLALSFLGLVCVVTLVKGYMYGVPYGGGGYGGGGYGGGTQMGIGGGGIMNFFFMRKSIQVISLHSSGENRARGFEFCSTHLSMKYIRHNKC